MGDLMVRASWDGALGGTFLVVNLLRRKYCGTDCLRTTVLQHDGTLKTVYEGWGHTYRVQAWMRGEHELSSGH